MSTANNVTVAQVIREQCWKEDGTNFVRLFVQKNVMAKCSLRVHKTRFGLQSYTIKTNLQTKSITYAANFYLLSLA